MSDESQWLVEPDAARIEIAVGPNAKLSPRLREALDQIMRAIEQESEVSGYMQCKRVEFPDPCTIFLVCKGVGG